MVESAPLLKGPGRRKVRIVAISGSVAVSPTADVDARKPQVDQMRHEWRLDTGFAWNRNSVCESVFNVWRDNSCCSARVWCQVEIGLGTSLTVVSRGAIHRQQHGRVSCDASP